MSTTTRRADRRALVAAGERYHAAKLAHGYEPVTYSEQGKRFAALTQAMTDALYALECYAVGRKKASVEYGHKHAARTKRQEGK